MIVNSLSDPNHGQVERSVVNPYEEAGNQPALLFGNEVEQVEFPRGVRANGGIRIGCWYSSCVAPQAIRSFLKKPESLKTYKHALIWGRRKSMTRTLRFVAVVFIVFAFPIHQAFADRIASVTATTTMGSGFGTSLANTVNGTGLSSLSLTATHDSTIPANSWLSAQGIVTGSVTFALGGMFQVDGFSFWNQNAGGPGANGSTGIQVVQVLTSTDGVSFAVLAGGPSLFAQVPGGGPALPQIFTFAPVAATHFRFNILSNYGDTAETGFAEVGFNSVSASVPEPATVGLLISGLITGMLGVRRLRSLQ
jgi:hypothetical protein